MVYHFIHIYTRICSELNEVFTYLNLSWYNCRPRILEATPAIASVLGHMICNNGRTSGQNPPKKVTPFSS